MNKLSNQNIETLRSEAHEYHEHNISVAMCSSQMQRCVISHVSSIDSYATVYQHLDNACFALHRRPVQQAKSMVITARQNTKDFTRNSHARISFYEQFWFVTTQKNIIRLTLHVWKNLAISLKDTHVVNESIINRTLV